jgi:glycerophosphoryl diester phosphodiesterase
MKLLLKQKSIMGAVVISTAALLATGFIKNKKPEAVMHTINVKTPADTKKFFSYSKDRIPFVSAHRGGPREGFPENCIATFENTLKSTYAILEIDPHFTKDSALVVMHDPTLNRTSNGTGRISDYTLAELRKLKLKDTKGKLTDYGMPTLDEALQWAKGKTILVIDAKEVPAETRVRKIMENKAEANAIVIVYSYEEAKKVYDMNKNIVMELMVPNKKKLEELDATGISWQNIIAFVTHGTPEEADIFRQVHEKGAMCIVGSSRTVDRAFMRGEIKSEAELHQKYMDIINKGADVIEADLGIEAGKALEPLLTKKSDKSKFFRKSEKPSGPVAAK